MAYFAQFNENNLVTDIIVVNDSDCMVNNVFSEQKGIDFCKSIFGEQTNWAQTFQTGERYHYAGVGYTWDATALPNGAFIPPPTYPSWIMTNDYDWMPPIPMPLNDLVYYWDESIVNWALYPDQFNTTPVVLTEQNLQGGGTIQFFPPSVPTPNITKWMWKEKGSSVKTEFINTNNSLTITIPTQETIEIGCINNGVEVWSGDIVVSPL